MKYKVVNELNHFEFHDADIISQQRENGSIAWTLRGLNATTKLSQCDFEQDMCIKEAHLLFEQVEVEQLSVIEYTHTSVEDGQKVNHVELRRKPVDAAETILQHIDTSGFASIISKSGYHQTHDGWFHVTFIIQGVYEFFNMTFRFKSATVEWDEYTGIAWYIEDRPQQQREQSTPKPD